MKRLALVFLLVATAAWAGPDSRKVQAIAAGFKCTSKEVIPNFEFLEERGEPFLDEYWENTTGKTLEITEIDTFIGRSHKGRGDFLAMLFRERNGIRTDILCVNTQDDDEIKKASPRKWKCGPYDRGDGFLLYPGDRLNGRAWCVGKDEGLFAAWVKFHEVD